MPPERYQTDLAGRHPFPSHLRVPEDVILVGEHSPYGARPEFALYPEPERAAGARLGQILELSKVAQAAAWRANLCVSSAWSAKEARRRAEMLLEGPWKRYLLCGVRAQAVFEKLLGSHLPVERVARCSLWAVDDKQFLAIPHPSGRCRAWNEPGVREKTLAWWRLLVPEVAP